MNNSFSDEKIINAIRLITSSDAVDSETAKRVSENSVQIQKAVSMMSKEELLTLLENLPQQQKKKIQKLADSLK